MAALEFTLECLAAHASVSCWCVGVWLSCRGGFGLSLYICKTWTAMRNFRYYFLTRNLIDTGLAAYDTSVRLLHAFKAFAFGLRVDSWFQWVPL